MAKDELLETERQALAAVAEWYTDTDWGFYNKLVRYSYVSIKPFFHGKCCLEMGPADGQMTKALCHDFDELVVVDAAERHVNAAVELRANITGHTALFEEFEPTERFDIIIMSHVLEHVTEPQLILRRAKQWLRDDGTIIVVVPNAGSLHRRLGVKLGILTSEDQLTEQDVAIGHRRVYTREELDQDIEAAGLITVAKGGIFLKLLSNAQMLAFEDEALVEGMFELGKDLPEYCAEIFAVAGRLGHGR
jgi:2-polyprenyl-3-methyl-5-hydroxy-6-metoxy-1,4-benzoquinol methylase